MQSTSENFIPILFKVLTVFVCLNIFVNFTLLYVKRMRMYKLLAIFWPVVLVVFITQGSFQTGNLAVSMAYSLSIFSCCVFAMIGLEAIGRKFPWRNYLLYFIPFYPATYLLDQMGFGFTVVAMPFAIATATPLLHAFIYIHIIDRKKTTRLQKVLGVVYFMMTIHCLNFALFRMDQGAQLWGWLVSYAIYDMLAILLPSIALEEANLSENERLEKLVIDKTNELNKSLKVNDTLLKVLIHDISNPLMVMKCYLYLYKEDRQNQDQMIEKVQKSQLAIENIISGVKNAFKLKDQRKMPLVPVELEECFQEISFLFDQTLKNKHISLKFNNHLSPNTKVLADQTSLVHSVLSNLVSNGIKFTSPNSKIVITAKEDSQNIILEVKDEGPGISQKMIADIMQNKELLSSEGTMGEKGSGLGLSIVKSFVDSYGGQIEFDSNFMHAQPNQQGTNVRITLDRA